jgi:GTP cyclohydrolase I
MAMRGVEKQNSYTVTSAMLGGFRENTRTRMEFLELLKLRSPGVGLSISATTPAGMACLDE